MTRRASSDELRRRNTELEALHETALGLVEGLELTVVLDAIVERAGGLIGTEHGYLYLVEDNGTFLRDEVATGVFVNTIGYRVACGDGLAGRVMKTAAPLVVANYRAWLHRRRDLDHLNIGALVGVPLQAGGTVAGVIGLAYMDRSGRFAQGSSPSSTGSRAWPPWRSTTGSTQRSSRSSASGPAPSRTCTRRSHSYAGRRPSCTCPGRR